MLKQQREIATVLIDMKIPRDIEKAEKITQQLGALGIVCVKSDLENDGFAPPTPWLEYEAQIYYSYEIDQFIENLTAERSVDATAE